MNSLKEILAKNQEGILICILVVVTLFFRLYKLSSIPFGLNNDTSWDATAAVDMLRGNLSPYLPYAAEGWRGEPIIRLPAALFTLILGRNPMTVRLASDMFGIATIIPLYLLLRLLFNKKIAWVSSFFVAISGWHITFSKVGWQAIAVPCFSTLTFYYFFKGIRSNNIKNYILSGIFLSGSLYTYIAARILPLFILCLCIHVIIVHSKQFTHYIRSLSVLIGTFIITSLPIIYYAFNNWPNYVSRASYLNIWTPMEHQKTLTPLFQNIQTALLLFTHNANGNDFFISEPLLDQPARLLFPLGVAIALWYFLKEKKKAYGFMLSWFIFALIPGIVSTPNGNRAIGTIPSVYFFSAIGLVWVISLITHFFRGSVQKILSVSILSLVLLYGTIVTYQIYLGPMRRELPGLYPKTYITIPNLKPFIATHDIYVTDNYPRELLTYFLYTNGDPFYKNYVWMEHNREMLSVSPHTNRGLVFVMWDIPDNQPITDELRMKYPSATEQHIPYINDHISRPASILLIVPPR
ncbi:MAG: glycosyltransferase family 39 protein [Candidatus Gottesmanbacteria bacterium]|nr:glycosyltransferase family 39 protein [Candidatus Gottesmanbacteria bacterium]